MQTLKLASDFFTTRAPETRKHSYRRKTERLARCVPASCNLVVRAHGTSVRGQANNFLEVASIYYVVRSLLEAHHGLGWALKPTSI